MNSQFISAYKISNSEDTGGTKPELVWFHYDKMIIF